MNIYISLTLNVEIIIIEILKIYNNFNNKLKSFFLFFKFSWHPRKFRARDKSRLSHPPVVKAGCVYTHTIEHDYMNRNPPSALHSGQTPVF